MIILRCIRNYYLYFYFHTTEIKRKKNKPADPFYGFSSVMLLVMSFHAGTLLYTFNAVGVEFITDVFREQLFYFRGNVNLFAILALIIAFLFTYLTCCYQIQYGEIEERLKKTKWLAKRSALKLIFLPILSFSLIIMSVNYFY